MWKLKKDQPPFEVVDGPLAGHVFTHDFQYREIPEEHKKAFVRVKAAKAPGKGGKKDA